MRWRLAKRTDPFGRDIADRHYNRQKVGSVGFAPPGRCLVLTTKTDTGRALWITSWPYARYVKHRWRGAWVCSAFRNEEAGLATELILEALAATQAYYGQPPIHGMVTFLDTTKVRPIKRRGEDVWGYTWLKAGFVPVGRTEGGLLAFKLFPCRFPASASPIGMTSAHRDYRSPELAAAEFDLLAHAVGGL